MRAEALAHISQIKAALALLRRFLDWDVALKRLETLNGQVEEPAFWNDPRAAQQVNTVTQTVKIEKRTRMAATTLRTRPAPRNRKTGRRQALRQAIPGLGFIGIGGVLSAGNMT